jgi:hypothetical protein
LKSTEVQFTPEQEAQIATKAGADAERMDNPGTLP